jgi:hypothetical protein
MAQLLGVSPRHMTLYTAARIFFRRPGLGEARYVTRYLSVATVDRQTQRLESSLTLSIMTPKDSFNVEATCALTEAISDKRGKQI